MLLCRPRTVYLNGHNSLYTDGLCEKVLLNAFGSILEIMSLYAKREIVEKVSRCSYHGHDPGAYVTTQHNRYALYVCSTAARLGVASLTVKASKCRSAIEHHCGLALQVHEHHRR